MHRTIIRAAGILAFAAGGGTAVQAAYPERPITYIVPSSPGGAGDIGARTWAPFLEQCLGNGTAVSVINKPGAGGAIGSTELAEAEPDGYTIGTVMVPSFVASSISRDTDWTPDDFTYLGTVVGGYSTINVANDSDIRTLADLVERARNSPTPLNVGVGGLSGGDHLVALQWMQMIDLDFNFVPFSDDANARNALLGGHIEVAMMSQSAASAFLGEFRTIGITSEERSPAMPDVPTFREQGFDLVAGTIHMVAAPAGTPDEVAAALSACIDGIAADPAFLDEAAKRSVYLSPMNAADTETFIRENDRIYREIWAQEPWIVE